MNYCDLEVVLAVHLSVFESMGTGFSSLEILYKLESREDQLK